MISAEEKRCLCIQEMGAELGAMYCDLNDHLLDILLIWRQYEQLFAVDEKTVHLLNATAPAFFGVIQAQLWDSVMLGISRLTDRPVSFGNKTLSIQALPELVDDSNVRDKVEIAVTKALSDADFARSHRNKRIAHNDLVHVQNRAGNALPGASREKIREGLQSIIAVLEILNGHYRESTMLYEDMISDGGAARLVAVLRTRSGEDYK
ncbi:hypothetical protein NAG83_23865 [Pseudomonas carnis]|uniref:AbiU2 domain-containing protein n=1 Tax=Pseudomonas carnis TaxID=2487355 RepID=UPI002095651A|nr:hypothetical protein [Pseudomonas carnis]MCO7039544.1 hypothetical protein [Pseudomonas carnis]